MQENIIYLNLFNWKVLLLGQRGRGYTTTHCVNYYFGTSARWWWRLLYIMHRPLTCFLFPHRIYDLQKNSGCNNNSLIIRPLWLIQLLFVNDLAIIYTIYMIITHLFVNDCNFISLTLNWCDHAISHIINRLEV